MRRAAVAALVLLAAGWALTLWVPPWDDQRVNDLFVYRNYAGRMLDGQLPYRSVSFEYPPLAAPVIALPGLLDSGERSFRFAFAGWTFAAAAAVVLLTGLLARAGVQAGQAGDSAARRAMLAAAAMPVLLGALLRTHFDLFPVALLLGALVLLVSDRPRAGFAVLGLAVMTKFFPIVVAPVAVAWLLGRGRPRDAWQGALVCVAVIAAIAAAAVAISPHGALHAVRYQLDRPVQIESSPASVLFGLDALELGEEQPVAAPAYDALEHWADGLVTAAFVLVLLAVLAVVFRAVASRDAGPRELVLGALATCAAFAVFGKVLSPQFLIWVIPLGALAFAWRLYPLAAAVGLAAALTQVEFPAHYLELIHRNWTLVGLVAVRNAVLACVVVLSVRELEARRKEQLLGRRGAPVVVGLD